MRSPVCATFVSIVGLAACSVAPATFAEQGQEQPEDRRIVSISVWSPGSAGLPGSCPGGSRDTAQLVLGPDGKGVNQWRGMATLSDERPTIFLRGTLPGQRDYLLFVPGRAAANPDASGLVVLSGGNGPAPGGQWRLDFARDYGNGGVPGSGSVRIRCLVGDVNGSQVVTLSDVLSVNASLAQIVGPLNFLRDVNLSGTLTLSDKLLVNSKPTQALPAP